MNKLTNLIEESYNKNKALEFKNFTPNKDDLNVLINASNEALRLFPKIPGSCVPLSTLLCALIKDNTNYPIYVVAGSLFIDNEKIFGDNSIKFKELFSKSDLSWDGHCWIIFGNYLCDISICKTAYSEYSPKKLKNKVLSTMGENKGIFICPLDEVKNYGFKFTEEYILTDEEITNGFNSARIIIQNIKK